MSRLLWFVLGVIATILVLFAGGYLFLRSGGVSMQTTASPLPLERAVARMALHARIAKEAPAQAPLAASEDNLAAGARIYREHCAYCHGIAGQPQTATVKGMFPRPPQLFKGKGVTDDPAGEIYWKTANGIRLTGMPGYRGALSEDQMWQVALLLLHANQLPAPVLKIIRDGA